MNKVIGYFANDKTHKMVHSPYAMLIYNMHMGGEELLDSVLGYCRIKITAKKWYHRISFHMVNLTAVNAWLLW